MNILNSDKIIIRKPKNYWYIFNNFLKILFIYYYKDIPHLCLMFKQKVKVEVKYY